MEGKIRNPSNQNSKAKYFEIYLREEVDSMPLISN